MDLKTFEQKLLKDPEFRKEYYNKDLAFEIGQMLIEARIIKGLTQAKLAAMVNTKQSGIARAENGTTLPSLSFLKKIAGALHTYLIVRFGFMEKHVIKTTDKSTNTKQGDLGYVQNQSHEAYTVLPGHFNDRTKTFNYVYAQGN
ncbi:helix-turn-helix transcriptional regulator [Candidatus Gottesmanbacteria bacterium]|nr:helix-turn-helix transcriptional regulator [Candidatus Gottesmanbacteria bacterium]